MCFNFYSQDKEKEQKTNDMYVWASDIISCKNQQTRIRSQEKWKNVPLSWYKKWQRKEKYDNTYKLSLVCECFSFSFDIHQTVTVRTSTKRKHNQIDGVLIYTIKGKKEEKRRIKTSIRIRKKRNKQIAQYFLFSSFFLFFNVYYYSINKWKAQQ